MSRWTVSLLKRIDPDVRLQWAARLFWFSLIGGLLSTVFLARDSYERVLMAISWGAITITCVDVVLTADVRDES